MCLERYLDWIRRRSRFAIVEVNHPKRPSRPIPKDRAVGIGLERKNAGQGVGRASQQPDFVRALALIPWFLQLAHEAPLFRVERHFLARSSGNRYARGTI